LFNEVCTEVVLQGGALLPMLEEAGITGYEMKQRVMFAFQMIRRTIADIEQQRAEERSKRKK